MPDDCKHGRMVSMPNGQEAILLGCYDNQEKIYKLFWNEDNLDWTTMTQTLKYPRYYNPIAMLLPDEMNTCKLGIYSNSLINTSSISTILAIKRFFLRSHKTSISTIFGAKIQLARFFMKNDANQVI